MIRFKRCSLKIYYSLAFYISKLYIIISTFFLKKSMPKENILVVLKPDAMGDYVLLRNFLYHLEKNNYKIFLIGNDSWIEIVQYCDSVCIDQFLPLNRKKFIRNFLYRTKILSQLGMLNNVEMVLYPCYSREGYSFEDIVKAIPAPSKIAWFGDLSNQNKKHREKTQSLYTELYDDDDGDIVFEFDRNRQFFTRFLEKELTHVRPYLDIPVDSSLTLPKLYAFIFVGASAIFRQWSVEKYAEVATYIYHEYGFEIVLGGAPNDIILGKHLEKLLYKTCPCINYVGKTTQVELIELIARSTLLLSNETAIPHIAVSLQHPNIFVVSNGNHYGRFTPYPNYLCDRYFAIYPPELEEISNEKEKIARFSRGSSLDIQRITSQSVIKKISEYIKL
ncbi:lipopolysaccharide core biosynthesis protein [Vibrio ruber DSM 16370]|uniref:Lipopolysaccharide core biosynthesis protein n=1 Tax=Vibrio ruber (strain DSM 16370 / JCM 11486 / BCRC 17186 / CECT 7878 / LMG 23124 / VR1) TaxID=1123498 RepID=A0A1R4LL84_VIBR1|nr:glycosyltransferase family 9 protein [Vibrio ruber]SJN57340.1 lipopolysaccharide core biosynthesis protein [Vibrio ruber DSM 16370]